jgi:hypothetical protein
MGQACTRGLPGRAPTELWRRSAAPEGISMSTEHRAGESPGPGLTAARKQPDLSRRSVIRGAAGLAGAGLAAGAITAAIAAPAATAAGPAHPAGRAMSGASRGEPVIVHIRDVRSGEMDVFAGTSHARLTDPGLAARLLRGIR